jgi:hypothetical protein
MGCINVGQEGNVYRKSRMNFKFVVGCCIFILLNVMSSSFAADPLQLKEDFDRKKQEYQIRKEHPEGINYISAHEALTMFNEGKLHLLDVNSKGFYEGEHIFGAVNCEDVTKVKLNFPKKMLIGIYCR